VYWFGFSFLSTPVPVEPIEIELTPVLKKGISCAILRPPSSSGAIGVDGFSHCHQIAVWDTYGIGATRSNNQTPSFGQVDRIMNLGFNILRAS
jgi:hypothetical protein